LCRSNGKHEYGPRSRGPHDAPRREVTHCTQKVTNFKATLYGCVEHTKGFPETQRSLESEFWVKSYASVNNRQKHNLRSSARKHTPLGKMRCSPNKCDQSKWGPLPLSRYHLRLSKGPAIVEVGEGGKLCLSNGKHGYGPKSRGPHDAPHCIQKVTNFKATLYGCVEHTKGFP
jgi:hypothetical protein